MEEKYDFGREKDFFTFGLWFFVEERGGNFLILKILFLSWSAVIKIEQFKHFKVAQFKKYLS